MVLLWALVHNLTVQPGDLMSAFMQADASTVKYAWPPKEQQADGVFHRMPPVA